MQSLSWLLDKHEIMCFCEWHCCLYTLIPLGIVNTGLYFMQCVNEQKMIMV